MEVTELIVKVIFVICAKTNGFYIAKAKMSKPLNGTRDVTIKGTYAGTMTEGDVYVLSGNWVSDPRYGKQFSFTHATEVMPSDEAGMVEYLKKRKIKGIKGEMAERIVRKFGKDTMDVIENHPEKLLQVHGIGKKRVEAIRQAGKDNRDRKELALFLEQHAINSGIAGAIVEKYKSESLSVVKNRPYEMIGNVARMGFQTVDNIALNIGYTRDCDMRLEAGLAYALSGAQVQGHCYLPREELLKQTVRTLRAGTPRQVEKCLDKQLKDNALVEEDGCVYLPQMYFSEMAVANKLKRMSRETEMSRYDEEAYRAAKEEAEASGTRFDEQQLMAVRQSFLSQVMVVTGGPGTGKTTVCKTIVRAHQHRTDRSSENRKSADILLAAPTGRAAKRMEQAIGLPASTIHRLLEYGPYGFVRNDDYPLEGKLLIVDESSMIDLMLIYALMKAVPDTMHVIFVGDVDQLPSVGAGNVLRDVILSNSVPVVRLQTVHRQDEHSLIVGNAHAINRGAANELKFNNLDPEAGFYFQKMPKTEHTEADAKKAAEVVIKLVTEYLPKKQYAQEDIQVLAPMKNGPCGVIELNRLLQHKLNPQKVKYRYGDTEFRLHDRVMQIKNNYRIPIKDEDEDATRAVFNGDIGRIRGINFEDRYLMVDFEEGFTALYDFSQLDQLTLAYACTIHKSQGSEYPVVVMPVMECHHIMMQRNLIYTGVTRAKKEVYIVGQLSAFQTALKNDHVQKRNTLLKEKLSAN